MFVNKKIITLYTFLFCMRDMYFYLRFFYYFIPNCVSPPNIIHFGIIVTHIILWYNL